MSGLCDRLIRGGIRKSERFIALRWHERDFFYALLCWVDDYGRFEADAEVLRGGLYHPRDMRRVTAQSVREMLMRCHEVGLVKLYTVDGRGYGRVLKFGQRLKFPKGRYPAAEDEQLELGVKGSDEAAVGELGGRAVRERQRRRLADLRGEVEEELARVDAELGQILRPGGGAYNVEPVGEKRVRYDELMSRRGVLVARLGKGAGG